MSRHAARARSGSDRANLYDEIATKIIVELETGRVPCVQLWGTASAKAPLAFDHGARQMPTAFRYPRQRFASLRRSGLSNELVARVTALGLTAERANDTEPSGRVLLSKGRPPGRT
jgi:hypothetical protein